VRLQVWTYWLVNDVTLCVAYMTDAGKVLLVKEFKTNEYKLYEHFPRSQFARDGDSRHVNLPRVEEVKDLWPSPRRRSSHSCAACERGMSMLQGIDHTAR
jgi:hypothetical protein